MLDEEGAGASQEKRWVWVQIIWKELYTPFAIEVFQKAWQVREYK